MDEDDIAAAGDSRCRLLLSFDVCYLPYICFVSDSSAGAAVQLLLRAGALVAGRTVASPVAADVDVNDKSRDDKGFTDAVVVARELKLYR